jgi:branched-chain amino acid aminotransferase
MAYEITVVPVTQSRLTQRRLDQQSFGSVFSDHMLVADYLDGDWTNVRIETYGPIPLPPSISALQYGISAFEGHKAFRTVQGEIVFFRPRDNCERLRKSCRRLALPAVPEEIYLDGLRQLVRIDRDWVPGPEEGSLYIRPCIFATDENIRVRPPSTCRFVIFTCPVGQYYAEPLKLLATKEYVRAFVGGTGDVKPAGNYAPTLLAEREALDRGYHSVLWLDGRDHRYVEEAGVMNIFFVIDGRVITPSINGTILPGITRDSAIALIKAMGVPVEERPISLEEVVEAHDAGYLQECFGSGTAATIAHIIEIGYQERSLTLPPVEDREIGPAVLEQINGLRTGRGEDRFGWLVPI